mmetsp:Transcript_89626/g.238069  ORF Transcript_89626/g.238069 Transcript_89626/m.238069 type:complete len:311 (-) Transcript_89626:106-1038(-)
MAPPVPVKTSNVNLETGPMGPLSGLVQEPSADPALDAALDAEEENRADCQDEGDARGEAVCLLNIARIRLQQKLVDKALTAARDAKNLFREAEDKVGESWALEFIAEVWHTVSSYDKAVAAAERAREQMKRVGDEFGEARMLFLAAQNRILPLARRSSADEVSKATKAAGELLDFCRKLNDPKAVGSALCTMSQVHLHKEKLKDALEAVEEAVPLFTAVNDTPNKASARLMEARIHFAMNSLRKSLDAVQESLQLFRSDGDEEGEKACIELLSKLREFEFRVDSVASPLTTQVGNKVRCGALEWAASRTQ